MRILPPVLFRDAEAIGGGAHARKRRVAGHMRALLSRADATTQVVLLAVVILQFSGGVLVRRTLHYAQCFTVSAVI